ncbi:DUF421 domain-containing protein [Guptibacillus hwajinpoensis]|uniref:Membrane protein n=1 Tax=Guptibacillus hwajinpoensis TaxID=208199 RepID=A0A0J6CSF5_9BACL|nr:DUF421 domain-containing protein [Alkalihalobacillus macyae]KMM39236.1 membrane protein [Alkalihalobacillus macyae]
MSMSELLLRLAVTFTVLFVLARIAGRKEISQMTLFNWVSSVAIGSLAANLVVNQDLRIFQGVIVLVAWLAIPILIGFIDIKFKGARKVTTGEPIIVIREGKIMEHSLRRTRLDIDTLRTLLREKNVFQLSEVDLAIFETNGKLSVLKTDPHQFVTRNDMNVLSKPKHFPIAMEVISDGVVNIKNLVMLNRDEKWLVEQMERAGATSPSEVFYAEVKTDGTIHVDMKGESVVR